MAALGPLSSLTISDARAQAVSVAQANFIEKIEVRGAQRVEPGTVRSYMSIQEGDPFDPKRIDNSLKSLFSTGLFSDVSLRREGSTLVVDISENPIINRLAFEGNHKLDTETLQSEVTLRPRVIYTRSKVQTDVKRILTLYRQSGRFAVTVEPKIIQLAQNRVDLVFEINEGSQTDINSIRFVGNHKFSDGRLREVIQTKESSWWRFFSTDDVYDPDRMNLDRELLRRFYLKNGYADFRVGSAVAELTPDRKDFFVTFSVDEGERYAYGKLEIEARLKDLKSEDLMQVLEYKTGDWYNAEAIDKTIEKLTDAVGTKGYAFVDVRPRVNRDKDKKAIDVKYLINEGPRVFVERINITGNVRTLDKVIRREFRIVEGDAFNASKMRRSQKRIQGLGFFDKVDITQVPGTAPDKTVVNANVEEKPTGQISIGAGFSSSVGPLVDFSIQERNFLGRGQDLKLHLLIAAEQSQVDLSFTEPYFLDRDVRAGFDLFHIERDLQSSSSFNLKRTGLRLRGGYNVTEDLSQAWRYTIRQSEIFDIKTSASTLIRAQEGTTYLSEVGHTIAFDKRDNRLNQTDGYIVKLDTDIAGLGGSVRHARNTVSGGQYFSLADKWILSVNGKAGYVVGIGKDVLLGERYFLGGDDLRGIETGGAGPRDLSTKDALGGEWIYSGSVSLKYPTGLPDEFGVSGRLFTDVGSSGKLSPTNSTTADTGSARVSIGTGFTWESPFGPLGLDFAVPVVKESFDKAEYVRINFGASF